jgi:hypothetical protein
MDAGDMSLFTGGSDSEEDEANVKEQSVTAGILLGETVTEKGKVYYEVTWQESPKEMHTGAGIHSRCLQIRGLLLVGRHLLTDLRMYITCRAVWRRYSEFEDLKKAVAKKHPAIKSLPFPKKTTAKVGKSGKSNEVVQQRINELCEWLRAVVKQATPTQSGDKKSPERKLFDFLVEVRSHVAPGHVQYCTRSICR